MDKRRDLGLKQRSSPYTDIHTDPNLSRVSITTQTHHAGSLAISNKEKKGILVAKAATVEAIVASNCRARAY